MFSSVSEGRSDGVFNVGNNNNSDDECPQVNSINDKDDRDDRLFGAPNGYETTTSREQAFDSSALDFFDDDHYDGGDDDNLQVNHNKLLQKAADGDDRIVALHEQLTKLGIDAERLSQSAMEALQDPTRGGANAEFGISALRAYRSFISPKKRSNDNNNNNNHAKSNHPSYTAIPTLIAAAANCARQVEFLVKRHKSHQAEWVRHTDDERGLTTTTGEEQQHNHIRRRRVFPLILLLDNVRSAFNVGSLFRTADACGCQLVVTTGITPHPFGNGADKLQKSALGAQRVVPSQHFATTRQAIQWIRETYPHHVLLGMETTNRSVVYTDLAYANYQQHGIVIVLGNEVTGVDTDLMPLMDLVIEIPMFGAKNSLNIAACAPVVLYEILRQWEYKDIMEPSRDDS